MTKQARDLIFLSYSHKDPDAYDEVRKRLLNRGLGDRLWDDTGIRIGDQWDERIQAGMDRAAVAVLILSEGYFSRRPGGGDYIIERELPYLIERYLAGELDLLPVYWSPSDHFAPEQPRTVKPFLYRLDTGVERSFDFGTIQAATSRGRLAKATDQDRLDALRALAAEAESRLRARTAAPDPVAAAGPRLIQGREPLSVEFIVEGTVLRRTFRVRGQVVPLAQPELPPTELADLRLLAGRNLPSATHEQQVGRRLYRLLFGSPAGDQFPALAASAWGLPPASTALALAVAAEVSCVGAYEDAWPLRLPWHLTTADSGRLTASGWSFETVPPELAVRGAPVLTAEPPLLFLFDAGLEGAAGHAAQTVQLIDRLFGFGADQLHCRDHAQVRERVRREPRPEVLYCYAAAGLDLGALADALGEAVPLIVLNLIGETPPVPPPALVAGRKVIVCVHADGEADRAREAGARWLQAFLGDTAERGHQRLACDAFGPRVRLWSGCADLQARLGAPRGRSFRPQLIKLLLDRVAARRDVADQAAGALTEGRGVLGLVAAGTPADHPDLLPEQVWQHYRQYREAGSRDTIRRFPLDTGPLPDVPELLARFASALHRASDDWADWLDREAEGLTGGDHLILSLEWRLAPRPTGPAPDPDPALAEARWRERWLAAWLELGTRHLATYPRTGVLLVHFLIVTAADAAAAARWTDGAQNAWRALRSNPTDRAGTRYLHLRLKPLSLVPPEDVEDFLERHYRLSEHHPRLDPYAVAGWVCGRTQGVFRATVDLVERLHDTGFQAAYDALLPPAFTDA